MSSKPSHTYLRALGLWAAIVALVLGAVAGTAWAQVAANLKLEYLPSDMVESGSNGNPDWNVSVGPNAAKLVNLPLMTLKTTPPGTPPTGITSSLANTGAKTDKVNQLNSGKDTWGEILGAGICTRSATMEYWIRPANITQARRIIYETGGTTGFAILQDLHYLGAQVRADNKLEKVYVDLRNVPHFGDLSGEEAQQATEWFQTAVVIDTAADKLDLYLNGLHVGDSNRGGTSDVIRSGTSTFSKWSGTDGQGIGLRGGTALGSNPNNNFSMAGPASDTGACGAVTTEPSACTPAPPTPPPPA